MRLNHTCDIQQNDYFLDVYKFLKDKLSDDYDITIDPLTAEYTARNTVEVDSKKINILLGMWDEYDSKFHRNLFDKYDFIFTQYISKEEEDKYEKLFSLPLGINTAIIKDREHIQTILPVHERSTDVFFSGHMSSTQRYESMINNINLIKNDSRRKNYKLDFNVTRGFMLGFKGEEYYNRLYNSKIVFCPPGNISNETYRLYEALMCGCVIISPTLPQTQIYKDIPVVQVDDFKNKGALKMFELLEDKEQLKELQQKNIDFWKNNFTQEKIADYIVSKIKK